MAARIWLPLMLLALALTGCNPAAKVIGKWEVDMDQAKAQVDQSNPLAALAAGMMSMMKVEMDFKADGGLAVNASVLGQSQSSTGTWKYVKTDGESMVLSVKMDNDPKEQELRVKFKDDDHMEMAPPVNNNQGQQALPFKRVKPS